MTKHTGEIDQYLTSIHQSTTQDNKIDHFWITKMSQGFRLCSRVGQEDQRFFRNLVVDPHMFSQVTRLDKRLRASWTLITNTKILWNTPYPLRNINIPNEKSDIHLDRNAFFRQCEWLCGAANGTSAWTLCRRTGKQSPFSPKMKNRKCTLHGILTLRCTRQQVSSPPGSKFHKQIFACLIYRYPC